VQGSGADIWGTEDAFQYAYTRLAGDGIITARLANWSGPEEWSKAGVMIRESLDPGAAHHFLLASAGRVFAHQRRLEAGSTTLHTALPTTGTSAVWFRIQRTGDVVRLFYARSFGTPDTWHLVEEAPFAAGEVLVGLAVTSHADGQFATGAFDNVSVMEGPNAGWISEDIGVVGIVGSRSGSPPSPVTMTASGTDIWGTADAFRFTYAQLVGNGTIVARVAGLDGPHAWTKAGVMLRQSTQADSTHAFMFVSRGNGLAFQRRTASGEISVHTSAGSGVVPQWVRLTRTGDVVTGSVSTDGVEWTFVESETLPIGTGPVLVGLALTSHDNAALANAIFESVSITP
jgi:regulation of enolase protein 1 (concanavalin A-like superfamily)